MSEIHPPKKTPSGDWPRKYILYRLDLRGWSLSQLSLQHYPSRFVLKKALERQWPKGQRIIAEAIGVSPAAIWPSRYRAVEDKSTAARRKNNGNNHAAD